MYLKLCHGNGIIMRVAWGMDVSKVFIDSLLTVSQWRFALNARGARWQISDVIRIPDYNYQEGRK